MIDNLIIREEYLTSGFFIYKMFCISIDYYVLAQVLCKFHRRRSDLVQ
ncbi:MAG: hypothetical protein FWG20_06500 [Candidatus Cloacimonetes bacterium]|nr:hypothetical protein [Candidatus Cloacimonadota bacterium]